MTHVHDAGPKSNDGLTAPIASIILPQSIGASCRWVSVVKSGQLEHFASGTTVRFLPIIEAILWLPVTSCRLLERLFLWTAGADWHQTGFAGATGLMGTLGLWLYRRPIASSPVRWAARLAAWPVCAVGLLWLVRWGWWAFLLVPLLRQGKRLSAAPLDPPEPVWKKHPLLFPLERLDVATLLVIACLAAILFVRREQFIPFPPDGYYHLAATRAIIERGSIPLWSDWEFAPVGRPHLYPPGFHLLIALCSLPFRGNVLEGFRVVQALMLPVAHLGTWYLARWLFDARRGFFAVLLVGMDIALAYMGLMGLPSILSAALVAVMLVFFLRQQVYGAAVLGALALYMHTGVPLMAFGGLLLFALRRREYLGIFVATAGLTAVLALPWYAHVWTYRHWFGHPIDLGVWGEFTAQESRYIKLLWLQAINLSMVLLMTRAWKLTRWREARNVLLLCQVIAFLPMLISYGGRYFAHTIHLWSILIAVLFVRLVVPTDRPRRILFFIVLALLCPTLTFVSGMGPAMRAGVYPMVSGWLLPPAFAIAERKIVAGGKRIGAPDWDNLQELARYIEDHTEPDQILHVAGFNHRQFAAAIGFLAHRPIDVAVWEEVWPPESVHRLIRRHVATDERGCFILMHGAYMSGDVFGGIAARPGVAWTRIGEYAVWIPMPKGSAEAKPS